MSDFSYIPDGYNLRARLFAVPGLHGPLEFIYRPMLRGERMAKQAEIVRAADPTHQSDREAKELADRIVRWDAVDHEQRPLAVNADNFGHLPMPLQEKMLGIVWGLRPADELQLVSPEDTERLNEEDEAKNSRME